MRFKVLLGVELKLLFEPRFHPRSEQREQPDETWGLCSEAAFEFIAKLQG